MRGGEEKVRGGERRRGGEEEVRGGEEHEEHEEVDLLSNLLGASHGLDSRGASLPHLRGDIRGDQGRSGEVRGEVRGGKGRSREIRMEIRGGRGR